MRDLNSNERRYAEFYRLYVQDFRRDVPIYLEFAAKHPGRILEVGCRAGRVTGHLAAAGHQVLAIDVSRPMLELAVEDLRSWPERVQVADFDLRQQPLPERFGMVAVSLFFFNELIDVEEQRLFLRHLRRSLSTPGVLVMDLFCPLALVRPDEAAECRSIERVVGGRQLQVRDQRRMLTPLLERRTQEFQVEGGSSGEHTTHRRYITPQQASHLLSEAGFESVSWLREYDLSTAAPVDADARPGGPFMMIAET